MLSHTIHYILAQIAARNEIFNLSDQKLICVYVNKYNKKRIYVCIKKNSFKALKKSEIVIFPGRILPCKQNKSAIYSTLHDIFPRLKAIAANWFLIVRTWGDTPATLIVCPTLGWRHQHVPNAVETFNRPLASV